MPRVLLLLRGPGGRGPDQHLRRLQQDSLRRLSQAELESKYVNQFAEYQFLYIFLLPIRGTHHYDCTKYIFTSDTRSFSLLAAAHNILPA